MATETVSKDYLEQLKTINTKCKEWLGIVKKNEATLPAKYKTMIKKVTVFAKLSARAYKMQEKTTPKKLSSEEWQVKKAEIHVELDSMEVELKALISELAAI